MIPAAAGDANRTARNSYTPTPAQDHPIQVSPADITLCLLYALYVNVLMGVVKPQIPRNTSILNQLRHSSPLMRASACVAPLLNYFIKALTVTDHVSKKLKTAGKSFSCCATRARLLYLRYRISVWWTSSARASAQIKHDGKHRARAAL